MSQLTGHTERAIKALQSKLRRVPAFQRGARHQIAARHCKDALTILSKNEDAALDHLSIAQHAAQAYTI